MSLLSTSRFPHSKFVIQIPGLRKLRHFHSIKQQLTGARTYTKALANYRTKLYPPSNIARRNKPPVQVGAKFNLKTCR